MPKLRADADATALWIPPINPDTDLEGDLQSMFQAGKCTVLDRNLVYWYGKDHNKVDRKAEKAEKVILYLHGGGYYEQNASPSNPTTNCLRILLSASAKSKNETAPKRALNVEYRLSDDTSFPGILSDALAAWKYLIDQGFEPKNILIAGDSAGANLTLALVRYLIQHRPFYPNWKKEDKVADGIVLYSPWVDLTLSFSQKASRNEGTDYLNPKLFAKAIEPLLEGLPKGAASNLLISCVSKDRKVTEDVFDGFPRALIFGG
jgi:acetyl esterase/lipase